MSENKPGSSLAKRTYLGFIWQGLGLSINTILSLCHLVIMARLLTPEIFGQFAIASIIVAMITITTEMGLGAALIQKDKLSEYDRSFVFLMNVSIALSILLILSFLAEPLSHRFEQVLSPQLIQVLGLNGLIVSLGMASKATLQREMRFKNIVFATSVSYLLGTLCVGIIIALRGHGVWALIIGLLVNNSILTLYFLHQAPVKRLLSIANVDYLKMLKYGAGLCMVQGVNQFSRMSDKLILATLSTLGFVGLYERSQQVQQMPGVFLGGIFDNVLFPALSRLSSDSGALGRHFFQFCTPAVLIGVYIATLIYTFSAELVTILLGAQWFDAIPILKILSILTVFQLLGRLSDTYVRATGIFGQSIKVKLAFLVLIFTCAYVGYQSYGDRGAIAGIVVASAMHAVLMLMLCSRHARYSSIDLLRRIQPALVLAVLLLAKNTLLRYAELSTGIGFFALVVATDLIVALFVFNVRILIGNENRVYLERRVGEFIAFAKLKFQ